MLILLLLLLLRLSLVGGIFALAIVGEREGGRKRVAYWAAAALLTAILMGLS